MVAMVVASQAMPATASVHPLSLRARIVSPLDDGGTLDLADGLLQADDAGRITAVGPWPGDSDAPDAVDLRPLVG